MQSFPKRSFLGRGHRSKKTGRGTGKTKSYGPQWGSRGLTVGFRTAAAANPTRASSDSNPDRSGTSAGNKRPLTSTRQGYGTRSK
jgi:hypothetical protein